MKTGRCRLAKLCLSRLTRQPVMMVRLGQLLAMTTQQKARLKARESRWDDERAWLEGIIEKQTL